MEWEHFSQKIPAGSYIGEEWIAELYAEGWQVADVVQNLRDARTPDATPFDWYLFHRQKVTKLGRGA